MKTRREKCVYLLCLALILLQCFSFLGLPMMLLLFVFG